MLYAVPCLNLHVGNHFARSPQIAIVDDQRQIKQVVSLVESDSSCNKKKQWISVIHSYGVQAVVVRHIGKRMLAHLFKNDIKVLASTGKVEIEALDFDHLQEVTDLDYGREPRNHGCGKKERRRDGAIVMSRPHKLGAIRGFRK
ncbi:NifB/NifX family molybdenum-iron cluster-binding protein [Vibrio cyclitrophicus]